VYPLFAQPSEARHAIREIYCWRLENPDASQVMAPPSSTSSASVSPMLMMVWRRRGRKDGSTGAKSEDPCGPAYAFETFTCKPLKKMVLSCLSLKKLFAPVCHRPKLLLTSMPFFAVMCVCIDVLLLM
jgi:hypothetical protein